VLNHKGGLLHAAYGERIDLNKGTFSHRLFNVRCGKKPYEKGGSSPGSGFRNRTGSGPLSSIELGPSLRFGWEELHAQQRRRAAS